MFEWINDRELVQLSAPFRPVDKEAHEHWFAQIQSRDDVEIYGIRLKEDDRLIGTCQLLRIDREHGRCELQIRIGDPAQRGRGRGTEAVMLLLRRAFEGLGLQRVQLDVFETNQAAIRSYEKAGFRREGVRRASVLIDDRRLDVIVMRALAGEQHDGD
jgi:RimJ/RimL family protein N-acetyltransferase